MVKEQQRALGRCAADRKEKMDIQKEYTKDGIKLTHPSGIITITTLAELRALEIEAKAREKMSEQFAEKIHNDINELIKVGAT